MKAGIVLGVLGLGVGVAAVAYAMSNKKDANCNLTQAQIDFQLKQALATQNPQTMIALANSFRAQGCESAARTAETAARNLATRGYA